MKKITVGLAALLSGYAANSLAALPNGTSSCAVCVPSFCGGFTFGLTGLYWRPSTPHLDYALTYPAFDPTGDFLFTNGRYHSVDHDYDWGFKANVGYVFPCSGNDVNLTYTHWDNDDHDSVRDFAFLFPATTGPFFTPTGTFPAPFVTTAPITLSGTLVAGVAGTFTDEIPVGTPFVFFFDPADLTEVSAHSDFENHTWDLDFGQTINVGCNFRLRWFGGLRYSRLEHTLDVTHDFAAVGTVVGPTLTSVAFTVVLGTAAGVTAVGTVIPVFDVAATLREIVNQKSDFDGIGPRFGFDASYHVGGGFGIVASLATSLLVGEIESTFSERIETAGVVTLDLAATTVDIGTVGGVVVTPGSTVVTAPVGPLAVTPVFPVELFNFKHPDETRVVPNIDAKIGLDWTYQFCNCSRSKVTVEAGYMVSHYFNAIDRLSEVGAFDPELRTRHTIDASFDGPYVGVQVNL